MSRDKPIQFPKAVKATPCRTRTQTVNTPTTHGNVRTEVRVPNQK